MRGETWVSVSLTSFQTESEWVFRCNHKFCCPLCEFSDLTSSILGGSLEKFLHDEKDDNGDDDDQIND